MNIDSFEGLLIAAALQQEPQQILLAFAVAENEPGPVPAREAARQTLVPVMCVAKQVGELDTFANLAEEAGKMGAHWDVLLVSTLAGSAGQLPDGRRTDAALQQMIGLIQAGDMARLVAFDRSGDLLRRA